jgi:hypothetical protein
MSEKEDIESKGIAEVEGSNPSSSTYKKGFLNRVLVRFSVSLFQRLWFLDYGNYLGKRFEYKGYFSIK